MSFSFAVRSVIGSSESCPTQDGAQIDDDYPGRSHYGSFLGNRLNMKYGDTKLQINLAGIQDKYLIFACFVAFASWSSRD